MIGRILSAVIGEKIGERYGRGGRGALIGAVAPAIARRMFGPLGLAVAGGYAAKKYYDRRRSRQTQGRFTP
jgi:hypothetical protein